MAGPMDIYNFIQQQGEVGRQRGQRNRLADLASQAYGAPQDQQRQLIGQAIQSDPESGFALGQSLNQDRSARVGQLSQKARMLVGYAKAKNLQGVNGLYPQLAREAESLGLGQGIPQQWDDSFLPGMEQLANLGIGNSAGMQEFSALTSGLSAEDAQRARRIKLGLDPRAVTGSRKTGTVKGADGHDRPYVFDPSSNTYQVFDGMGWRDMSPGEAQQAESAPQAQSAPPPGLYNTPNGQARIGDNLTPEQWQLVQADMANNGQADQYQLPQRDVSPAQFYGGQRQPTPQAPQAPQGGALPPRYDYQAGGLLVGQSAAEQAGLSEEAKLRAQLQYAPQVAQAEAEAARLKKEAEQRTERMPPAVMKMVQEAEEKAGTASGILSRMSTHRQKIASGDLQFGPLANTINRGRNFAGQSTEQSRNFQLFMSDLEKMRNDSLRLNNGVQTEGDAQRAWNELFANLNDTKYVLAGLDRIDEINQRAAALYKQQAEEIRSSYPQGSPSAGAAQGVLRYNPETGDFE